MRFAAVLLLVGCAQGSRASNHDGSLGVPEDSIIEQQPDAPATDAPVMVDAKPIDAPPPPPDAAVDAPMAMPPDAYQCTVITRQLLLNPVFDLTPLGTNWVMQNIDNAYPVITDQ